MSPISYPNLNTLKGNDIYTSFGNGGLPGAIINRTEDKALGLDSSINRWMIKASEMLNQEAECNIAGQVSINPDTRLARITVEVYYTADSKVENNYLTVIMLQDSIIGSQSGAMSNPEQIVGDQYCHMHVYRNTITEKWGNEIPFIPWAIWKKKVFISFIARPLLHFAHRLYVRLLQERLLREYRLRYVRSLF